MIDISNYEVVGFEHAIRGMRNPMNSWEKSDSYFGFYYEHPDDPEPEYRQEVGTSDLKLMKKLCKAGTDHRKFMRMIVVYADITAPMYWWKEFDTYKVGTVANSCSTMHKIHEREFTVDDFSCEHLLDGMFVQKDDEWVDQYENPWFDSNDILQLTIKVLNYHRVKYLETEDKKYWWQMIQLLPSSYNQKRTVMLNYEVLANMYFGRKDHKLDEWHEFCDWALTLPYFKQIIGVEEE